MSSVFFSEVLPGNGEVCRDCLLRKKNGSKKTCASTISKNISEDGKFCGTKIKRMAYRGKEEKGTFSFPV